MCINNKVIKMYILIENEFNNLTTSTIQYNNLLYWNYLYSYIYIYINHPEQIKYILLFINNLNIHFILIFCHGFLKLFIENKKLYIWQTINYIFFKPYFTKNETKIYRKNKYVFYKSIFCIIWKILS